MWQIDTGKWYEFASILGAFLLAATLLVQIRSFRRQQIEAKFFEMVKYYRENVNEMKLEDPFSKKPGKFVEGRIVFKVIFNQIRTARKALQVFCLERSTGGVNSIKPNTSFFKYITKEKFYPLVDKDWLVKSNDQIITNLETSSISEVNQIIDKKRYDLILNDISYLVTFFGVPRSGINDLQETLTQYKTLPINIFLKFAKAVPVRYSQAKNIDRVLYLLNRSNLKNFKEVVKIASSNSYKTVMFFGGHQYRLGHYFRHFFQTVRYIDSQPNWLMDNDEKKENIKMLRAQMSNYEQALLFLNSLSSLGRDWEYEDKYGELITKYELIKNLPKNFVLGMNPKHFYPQIKFDWEHHELNNQKIKEKVKKEILNVSEINNWRKEISPSKLIFANYSIFEKILIWSSALIGGGSIYFWFYLNHIIWYWLLLFIPILSVFVPVQLLKKKKENIIRDHCDRLSIDRNIGKPRLSLIQQKIIEKKLGINTTNKEYLEFLISHFQNKAKKVKYNYPILIWALTLSLSSYLAFTFGVFAKSVNSWQEFVELSKPLLKIIGGILYALAIVEFSLIRTYAIRSKYQTIIEILKNIQLNNLSKKG
jgi:hypothetical protein